MKTLQKDLTTGNPGKIIFNFAFVALCGALQTHFHGRIYLLFFLFHCSRRTHARRER